MKRTAICLITFSVIILKTSAQSAGDYQSIARGNWNNAANWAIYDGNAWVPATTYPGQNSAAGAVTILAFGEIRITATVPHLVASLSIQGFYDSVYEFYFGTLTFSAETAVSLMVSGTVEIAGILNIDDQAGSKSHVLFIGGSLYGTLNAINADDKINVVFNSNVPTSIITGGTFQDVTFNGNIFTVSGSMFIHGNVSFMRGVVNTSPEDPANPPDFGLIHFKKGATWSGASNLSYVDGWVGKEGDEPFTFPVGENGIYAPLTISAPVGQTQLFFAKYKRTSGSDLGGITDPGLFNVSQCEYWDLMPGNGEYTKNYPLAITVSWDSSRHCGSSPYITNVSDVTLAHFNGTSWNSHGGTATGTPTNGSVTWSYVTTFSPFTLGNIGTCRAPSGLSTSNITGNSATVSWSAEPGAVSYDVYYSDFPSAPTSFWKTAIKGTTLTSVNLSGLNQSTNYYYRVRTNCSSGSSSDRQSGFTTLTVCQRPTGLATYNITGVSATLSWEPVPGAISYQVEYGRGSGSEWIPVNSVITSTSYTLVGLTTGTYYSWRVRASCPGGYSHYQQSDVFWTSPIYCNDIYEPNNTSSQAKSINTGSTISAAISYGADADWFKVTMPNNSSTGVQVVLRNLSADYDLYLYDKSLILIASSTNPGITDEVVSYDSRTRKATYFIKVVGKMGSWDGSQCYNLLAQAIGGRGSVTRATYPGDEITDGLPLIYPNPTSEFVNLRFSSTMEGSSNVQIWNAVGQLVKQYPVNIIKGLNQVQIPLHDFRPGIYILKVNKDGLNIKRKFAIAK